MWEILSLHLLFSPYVDRQIAPFSRGRIYKSRRGPRHPDKTPLLSSRHLSQIYDVQLQTRMLTVFPISLSNALVVVTSKGYLAFQQGRNQFMAPPRRSEQRPHWLCFLFSCTAHPRQVINREFAVNLRDNYLN